MYGYSSVGTMIEVFGVLALILAIAATVLAFIFIIPEKKRAKLPKFFQIVHDVFNFKGLILEVILKALYIFTTIYVFTYSFFMIFTGYAPLECLLTMILGPVAVRIAFEFIMMAILLVKNVISINNKLKSQDGSQTDGFSFDYTKYTEDKPAKAPAKKVAPQNVTISGGKVCPNCGNIVSANGTFCNNCGYKMDF